MSFGVALLSWSIFSAADESDLETVNIEFLSALIGPSKVNGNPWDSQAKMDRTATALISDMIAPGSGFAASSVVATVSENAPKGISAPDVVGYVVQRGATTRSLANVAGIPMALANLQSKTQDSYTPRFYASYDNWPVFPNTRFQIQLWDHDLTQDDQIAVVELNYEQLMQANKNGEPTWINVSQQGMNQLLYILISVSPSLEGAAPKMNGYRW